jgi:hypothetical protein
MSKAEPAKESLAPDWQSESVSDERVTHGSEEDGGSENDGSQEHYTFDECSQEHRATLDT